MIRRCVIAGAIVTIFACGPAVGQPVPHEMTWTAYDSGSSGFNVAVAIGQQLKQAYGTDVRVLPSGNDTGRLAPVKANRVVISQMRIGTATGCNGLGLAVAGDTGVKEIKDIKGKRLGMVVGSPALTQGALALIAFGGLGERDVTPVPFASNNAMWKSFINNEVDVALTSTLSGQSKEAAASPRGVVWPALPAADRRPAPPHCRRPGWIRSSNRPALFLQCRRL